MTKSLSAETDRDDFNSMRSFLSWSDHKRGAPVFALIAVVGLIIYGRSLWSDFVFDDYTTIVNNPFIKRPDLLALWRYDPSRFLTNLTFTFNYSFFGLDCFSWHAVNLLLHIGTSFLLYGFLRQCLRLPKLANAISQERGSFFALAAALIFLVHPVQSEAVIYTVHRSTLLCTFFILAGLSLYGRGRLENSAHFLKAAVVVSFLGMMTKPLFMVFPLLVVLLEVYGFGIDRRLDLRRAAYFFLICLPLLVIPLGLLGLSKLSLLAYSGYQSASWAERLITQFNVIVTYIRLLFIPFGQNLDYDYPLARTLFSFPTLLSFFLVAGLIVFALFSKRPWMSLSILWFFVSLLPVVIFPLNDLIFEHWLYLPMAGFAFLAGYFLNRFFSRGKALAVFTALAAVFAILTFQRGTLWADKTALLEDTLAKSPGKARVHNNVGLVYLGQGRKEEAQKAFEQAIALDPEYFAAYNNLGLVYLDTDRIRESRDILEKTVALYPDYADAHINLGQVYERLNEERKALEHLDRGLERNPFHPSIYVTMGNIYQKKREFVRAREAYQKAIWLKPEDALAFYNLGNVYFKEGNFFEALQAYDKARALQPGLEEAYVNSGNIYFYFGDYPAAIEEYRKAVAKGTELPEAYFNLANALHATGAVEESKAHIQKAIALYEQQGKAQQAAQIRKKLEELGP